MMKPLLRDLRARLKLLVRRTPRPTILMYHSIGTNAAPFTVSSEAFVRQMRWLKDNGWTVVALESCVRRALAGETGKLCALTFDDGYRDFVEQAAPTLQAQGFPATVFLITGKMGGAYTTSDGVTLALMDWQQAREMSRRPSITFGSHTVSHRKLHAIPPEDVRRELVESRAALARELSLTDPGWLCYPRGRYTDEVRRMAREAGYLGAVAVAPGHPAPGTDRFAVPRAYMHSEMGMKEFEACLV